MNGSPSLPAVRLRAVLPRGDATVTATWIVLQRFRPQWRPWQVSVTVRVVQGGVFSFGDGDARVMGHSASESVPGRIVSTGDPLPHLHLVNLWSGWTGALSFSQAGQLFQVCNLMVVSADSRHLVVADS